MGHAWRGFAAMGLSAIKDMLKTYNTVGVGNQPNKFVVIRGAPDPIF